jgi:acyl carrier protein
MLRNKLIALMVTLLQDTLTEQNAGEDKTVRVSSTSPLVGRDAILTSLGLVSFIADVEASLEQMYQVEVTLVSESALSRSSSPFRTVETLADYVLKLVGEPLKDGGVETRAGVPPSE